MVTERGQRLRRIYGERDLFTALLQERGVLSSLSPEELAAFSTLLVYQAKREDEGAMPVMPTKGLSQAVRTPWRSTPSWSPWRRGTTWSRPPPRRWA